MALGYDNDADPNGPYIVPDKGYPVVNDNDGSESEILKWEMAT